MKTNVKENALILKYSDDKLQLLTPDNQVFAFKSDSNDRFKIAIPDDERAFKLDNYTATDPQPTPHSVRIRVCIGVDDNGKCTGWTWEVVWEY
jgi:hypothetical protein